MKMDHFLRVNGVDYFERKAAFKERQYPSDEERERRKEAKKPKRNARARDRMAQKRKDQPDLIREYDRSYRERNKSNPDFIARRRAASERFEKKIKEANAEKKAERDRIRNEHAAEKVAAREVRLALIAENKAKRQAIVALRPARVRLTEEQRKACRRDEKKNYKHRRRALLRGQEAKATPKQIREAMVKAKKKCYYCGQKSKLTIDHVVPLASGGSHTLDNIVFACHGCNSEKRDLPAHEFGARFGILLA